MYYGINHINYIMPCHQKIEIPQAVMYSGIISLIFLIFALFSFIKERAKNTYEAAVTKQKSSIRHNNNDGETTTYTEYITYISTTSGKKKKYVEHDTGLVVTYQYLHAGDRFKYHPKFHFPYELYDKSKAPYICCVSCGTKNSIEADCCKKCNLPLLK